MVYKKYIKKGGKTFGPYYYESYRDENGKVKKKYLGSTDPTKKKLVSPTAQKVFLFSFILLFALSGVFVYDQNDRLQGGDFSSAFREFVSNTYSGVTGLVVDDEVVFEPEPEAEEVVEEEPEPEPESIPEVEPVSETVSGGETEEVVSGVEEVEEVVSEIEGLSPMDDSGEPEEVVDESVDEPEVEEVVEVEENVTEVLNETEVVEEENITIEENITEAVEE
ncbi:hypothetical protein HNV12_17010, partial [Methanococcoides sp. SA1]|nr:hypothetical protein [Methanococcoides sp. SA1]